jgi:putative inorganic carbon (hco3(-)) transporter
VAFFFFILVIVLTYLRPVEVFIPALAEARVGLIVAMLALIVASVSRLNARDRAFDNKHLLLLGVFVFAIFASQATRGWLGGAISSVASFAFSGVFFALGCMNITNLDKLKSTMRALIFCATALAFFSVFSYHTGFMSEVLVLRQTTPAAELFGPAAMGILSPTEDFAKLWLWRIRSFGFLSDPNDFAQFLLLGLFFNLAFIEKVKFLKALFISLPTAGLLLYAVYLTHSRGAILGLGAMLFVLCYTKYGVFKTALFFTPPFVGALVLSVVSGGREFSAGEESAGGRIAAWSEGLVMLKNRPIFGVGFESFTDHHAYTAHNTFVLCFAELGLVGYFAWLGLLIFVLLGLKDSLTRLKGDSHKELSKWTGVIAVAIIGFMTCSFFLSRTYSPTLYILLAMGAVAARLTKQTIASKPLEKTRQIIPLGQFRQDRWLAITLAATLASIFMFYCITIIYWRYFGRA